MSLASKRRALARIGQAADRAWQLYRETGILGWAAEYNRLAGRWNRLDIELFRIEVGVES